MTTTVPPVTWVPMQNRNGAAWYSGAGDRYRDSSFAPNSRDRSPATPVPDSSSGVSGIVGNTPLGRPVVPEL